MILSCKYAEVYLVRLEYMLNLNACIAKEHVKEMLENVKLCTQVVVVVIISLCKQVHMYLTLLCTLSMLIPSNSGNG